MRPRGENGPQNRIQPLLVHARKYVIRLRKAHCYSPRRLVTSALSVTELADSSRKIGDEKRLELARVTSIPSASLR